MAEQNKKPVRIQHKIDTAANWSIADPILLKGEIGIESDTKLIKIGNGIDTWNMLSYAYEEQINDLYNTIDAEITERAADRTLSNLTDIWTARANLDVPPYFHAFADTSAGPGTPYDYGHVRTEGKSSAGNYVKIRYARATASDLNSTQYTYSGEYYLSFKSTTPGAPETLLKDAGPQASSSTTFYGILTTENYQVASSANSTYGVRQILSIPKFNVAYERYGYNISATTWNEWRNISESAGAYIRTITVPFDGWLSWVENEEHAYYYYDQNIEGLEETDAVIIDIIPSDDKSALFIEAASYLKISKVEYGDGYLRCIAYEDAPLINLTLKVLVLKTQKSKREE